MNKSEMIALRKTLYTISTTGEDTIKMTGCLNFLNNKIVEAAKEEEIRKQMPEAKNEQVEDKKES